MTNAAQSENGTRRGAARRGSRLARLAATLAEVALLGALAAWLVGRVVGDRFLWAQYLEWIPTEAAVVFALGVTVVTATLRRGRRRFAPLAVAGLLLAWLVLGEWRMHRAALPGPREPAFTVAFMNISYGAKTASLDPLLATDADVFIVSNTHPNAISFERIYGFPQSELLERTLGIVPGESPPGEKHFGRFGGFRVCSRFPIRRRAAATVRPQETWLEDDIRSAGHIVMVELDTPDGPLVVWMVDMPRTLGASRRELFEQARRQVEGVSSVFGISGQGLWVAEPRREGDPLFEPDLVVGDFNTPGHAWSVGRFAPGTRPVRADAGFGPSGTWPAGFPLFEIDLARLGPRWEATRAGRVAAPGVRHLGLVIGLTPAD